MLTEQDGYVGVPGGVHTVGVGSVSIWYVVHDSLICATRRVKLCYSYQRIDMCSMTHSLQHTAVHSNTLQHTATHCNTLQHTATYIA